MSSELQAIYLSKIAEAIARSNACEAFLAQYSLSHDIVVFESAVLQFRKALEAMAFAAIAPNKSAYQLLRTKAETAADYRKDFHATRILKSLESINADFYPVALLEPKSQGSGKWHFERRILGVLTKKQFIAIYDRLGKFLHSDNPWGNPNVVTNLLAALPEKIAELRALLARHFTTIRSPEFTGVWVIEAPTSFSACPPRIIVGTSDGEFVVEGN